MSARDIVTDPAIVAKLPQAAFAVRWHWFWFRTIYLRAVGRYPRFYWRHMLYLRTRLANAEDISIGPLKITRPKPWLLWPARALHPQAFEHADLVASHERMRTLLRKAMWQLNWWNTHDNEPRAATTELVDAIVQVLVEAPQAPHGQQDVKGGA